MGDDGVLVECLSCNQRDRVGSPDEIGRDGDWKCPQCSHGVALLVREDDGAP